ncbi:MAG: hypothetical protein O3C21_14395 [Verrucomicrobia bacterium]|nr:hypothetical protein [Verrucomicrobiota bacterium]
MKKSFPFAFLVFLTPALLAQLVEPVKADLTPHLAAIQAVENEGKGNKAASAAWEKLSTADAGDLVTILGAMDKAGPLASNWLRSAVDVISDRTTAEGARLPVADLGEFLLDQNHSPRARRLAFDLIRSADAATADKLVPGMLMDPSPELRREAVDRLISEGNSLLEGDAKDTAALVYRQALNGARDVNQIKEIAAQLEKLERPVDLPKHFGFLMHWNVIGPFDNTGRAGFDQVFPPEESIDLAAEYDGKGGKAKWVEFVTADPFGKVDINKAFGMEKEVTAYATTEFLSANAQPAELRLGSKNAWKIWLNGELVFGRDEYHRGAAIDQYQLPISLKEGKNTLLVKLCQNEQTETWTVEWEFQLRVCDATGTAILATDRPATPTVGTDLQQAPDRRKAQP